MTIGPYLLIPTGNLLLPFVASVSGLNLRTLPPYERYVVSSDGSHHSGSYSEATSFVRSLVADAPIVTVAITTTVDADVAAGLKARDVSKDFENIRDSTSAGGVNADAVSISKLKRTYTSSDSFYLYYEFNVGAARQVCLGAEVRMQAEHTLEKKGELKDKCAEHNTLLSEKDAEIAHLKSLLSLKETEAAEAISLRSQLSAAETADAAKSTELRDLKEKNFSLEGERNTLSERVTTLESVATSKEVELAYLSSQVTKLTADLSGFQLSRDELNSKVASLESERDCLAAQKSSLEVAELDAQLSEMAIHLDEEFYPRFLTTISGRRWFLSHRLNLVILKCLQFPEYLQALGQAIGCAVNKGIQDGLKAGIDHGKAGRDLSVVEAYDPSAEEKYVDVVNALGAVDFSLLSELESKKDSSIVDLMDSLRLEGVLAEILGAENLQPSPEQLILPIHGPEDNVVFAETSLSSYLEIVNLRVQRFREEAKEKRLLLTDVMTPFVEPLSSKSLTSEASTSAASPITTLSTTFASSAVIPPSSVVSDQVLDVKPHSEDPSAVTFEKEELGTSPE
ncbi:hypothetical protein Tco_0111188 [Tanacetum coccineum]